MRLAHRQLVALRPSGARQFILCHVDWLIEGPDQSLTIGARALKGEAKACAVRTSDRSAPRSDALMLPVAPGLSPALVLPTGWYRRAGTNPLAPARRYQPVGSTSAPASSNWSSAAP